MDGVDVDERSDARPARPRRWRTGVAAAALALPLAVVAWGSPRLADLLAIRAARPVVAAGDVLWRAMPTPHEPTPLPPTPEAAAIAALDGREPSDVIPAPSSAAADGATSAQAGSAAAARSGNSAGKSAGGSAAKLSGVLVRRARVVAAAKAGHRPSGSPVAATDWRPAGLALVGVAAIGVGLRDGDVVTRVGGTAATSLGAVIGAASGALRSHAPAIGAEVWRGRRKLLVTVELPRVRFKDEKRKKREKAEQDEIAAARGSAAVSRSREAPGTLP